MTETPPPYDATVAPDTPDTSDTPAATPEAAPPLMVRRFRGFLPVVVDVETGGFQPGTDALLQIAGVLIDIDSNGRLHRGETHSYHVRPFENSRLDPASLLVNKIDPWHPLRPASTKATRCNGSFARYALRSAATDAGARCWWDTMRPSTWRS